MVSPSSGVRATQSEELKKGIREYERERKERDRQMEVESWG